MRSVQEPTRLPREQAVAITLPADSVYDDENPYVPPSMTDLVCDITTGMTGDIFACLATADPGTCQVQEFNYDWGERNTSVALATPSSTGTDSHDYQLPATYTLRNVCQHRDVFAARGLTRPTRRALRSIPPFAVAAVELDKRLEWVQ